MRITTGRVIEVHQDPQDQRSAWIECPADIVPQPGQFLLAWDTADEGAPLATPVYLRESRSLGFLTAPGVPTSWEPGSQLHLQGPSGHGFALPGWSRRLALIALDDNGARLLPLIIPALAQNAAVAFFSDGSIPALPLEVEIHPLVDLKEGLAWADFMCLDMRLERLATLRQVPALHSGPPALSCPAQAFILTSILCGGVGECGACAVPVQRGWKNACQDGPVFNLQELDW